MFDYKMILIYVLLLPLFGRIVQQKSFAKIAMGVATAILPFAFMYEVQESLSMDTVMGLLFAYAIMQILTKKRDLFDYYKIAVALLCLTLIKTIALIFTMICLAVWIVDWFIRRKENGRAGTELLFWIGSGALSLLAYFSWKLFCARNGNTNYLSRNLSDSLKGNFALPDYAAETIGNMFRSLFTMSTNLGRFGFSVAAVLGLVIAGLLILKYLGQLKKSDVAAFLVLFLGFAGYFAVLVYTYLFVFEPWEAESLSSLDRYLGTYSLMFATLLLYRLSFIGEKEERCWQDAVLPLVSILLLLSLTGSGLLDVLLPGRYLEKRRAMYEDRQEVHAEMAAFLAMDLEPSTMLTVNCEGNTVYDRAIDYEVLPHISRPLNTTEYAPEDRNAAINEAVADMNPDYVYFSAHERAYEDIGRYTLPAAYQRVKGFDGLFHRVP